jgi:hypothetical protein
VTNKARTIALEHKILRDLEFFRSQLSVPTDGKGFWVGKKSLHNWRRLAKVALEDKIINEVQEWQLNRNNVQVPNPDVILLQADMILCRSCFIGIQWFFCLVDLRRGRYQTS